MKYLLFAFLFLSVRFGLQAQDTLTVMQYNLLYYGEITGFCNTSNNSLEMKDPYLRSILDYVKPDIFTVNEMSQNENIHQHMLDENLNINFVNYYKRAASSNTSGSTIVNMMYYDSRKLRLKAQFTAQNFVRDVDVFQLYYISNDLALGDTAFVVCVVAHLKAGNSSGDASSRKVMADNTLRFLETRFAHENVLFMGDFNFYSGTEAAYQTMLNYSNADMRFLDPIDQMGAWNNNAFYAGIHTQSTNTNSNCKSGGGLDDRFDFILISDEVRFGTNKVRYVQESYKAVGQDGQHFNSTMISPPQNAIVPENIATALYNFSDHLPVTLQLRIEKTLGVGESNNRPFLAEISPNPVGFEAKLSFYMPKYGSIELQITDINGRLIRSESIEMFSGKQSITLNTNDLQSGIYILSLIDSDRRVEHLRLLKL